MVRTKEILRDAFWELLEEKPYNKITVQDIVDCCHVNRNTFYYHFQDIPSLMMDSIEGWIEDVIQRYSETDYPLDCLRYMARECMKRRIAFLHLFRSIQKDMFLGQIYKMGHDVTQSYITQTEKYDIFTEDEKATLIRAHKCTFVGSLLDWLEGGATYDLEEHTLKLYRILASSKGRMLFDSIAESES